MANNSRFIGTRVSRTSTFAAAPATQLSVGWVEAIVSAADFTVEIDSSDSIEQPA
jgi:hypothetical protein